MSPVKSRSRQSRTLLRPAADSVAAVRWAGRVARAATTVDRAALDGGAALRAGLATGVLMLGAVATDRVADAVPAAIGLLFITLADPGGADRVRVAVMARTAALTTLAVLLGAIVADPEPLHIAVAIVFAAVCGFAGAVGPRTGFGGVLCLVVFVIFSGGPADVPLAAADALRFAVGALSALGVVAVIALAGRGRGPRQALARMLRGLAAADPDDPLSLGAPVHATRERTFAAATVDERPGVTRAHRYAELVALAHASRLGFFGLSATTGTAARSVVTAAQAAARACARTVVRPAAAGKIGPTLDRLAAAVAALPETLPSGFVAAAHETRSAVERLAAAITTPLPPIRNGGRPPVASSSSGVARSASATGWRTHLRADDPLARHALRLGLTIGAATALASALSLPHPYWIPLTVAWVSRPGLGETTVKVAARVLGTIIGIAFAAFVVEVLDPGRIGLALALALAAAVAGAFLTAAYAVAVGGITAFVIFLFRIVGQQVESAYPSRMIATLIGGALVLLAALCWPTRSAGRSAASLADYADALARYIRTVLGGNAVPEATCEACRAHVLEARIRATAVIEAAEYEPGRTPLSAESAHEVLEALHLAAARSLSAELAGAGPADRAAAEPLGRTLDALAVRLREPAGAAAAPLDGVHETVDHPIGRAIRHAEYALGDGPSELRA